MTVSDAMLEASTPDLTPGGAEPDKEIAGRSPMRIAFDRLKSDKIAIACTVIVLVFVVIAIFAPLLCDLFGVKLRDGGSKNLDQFNYPVIGPPDHPFTWKAPLGIQPNTGYDLLAEWLYGARTSLEVASITTVVATVLGVTIGLLAGFSRGWLDRVITFITDFFLSLPFIMVALAVSPMIVQRYAQNQTKLDRAQFISLILILSCFGWMTLARLIRGEVISLREREFIQAARVIGAPTRRILFKELLPNLVAPIVVAVSLGLPAYITAEAGLAYLGIGLTGRPSWGQTINKAVDWFNSYPLYLYAPVVGILLLVVALNLLGDAIRDAVDPKTRR